MTQQENANMQKIAKGRCFVSSGEIAPISYNELLLFVDQLEM